MIRKATTQDIPAIRAMAQVVFRQTYRDILSSEQMDYMMDWMYSEASLLRQMTDEGQTFLVEDGCGYVSFHPDGMTDDGIRLYHLEKLYVMPDCQNTGLGRRLFNQVVEHVKAQSSSPARIELNVNRHNGAVTFYEHLGMFKSRSGDFPIGHGYYMNDYIMAIDL